MLIETKEKMMNKTQLKKWIKNNISTRPTPFGTYYGVDLRPLGVSQAIHVSIDKNKAIAELTDENKSSFKTIYKAVNNIVVGSGDFYK
tara:strand:+ start:849 stop:1112 length:264 start_codon:yes stop_codon:yes gene_type:complete